MKIITCLSPPLGGWMAIFFLLLLYLTSCIPNGRKNNTQKSEGSPHDNITLIFAGDVMHHVPQLYASYVPENKTLDYSPCFQFIKPYIEQADLAFCNMETPFAGKPYSGYPQFSAPDELLFALKDTGFDIMQLANNHVVDRGSAGLERTIRLIKDQGLYPIGAYTDQHQREKFYPPIYTIKGLRIAFLNYTYGTNGLPVMQPNLVNMFDSVQIIKDIYYAKMNLAELVVATVHWGWEYQLQSDKIQHDWADFLVSNGVDLIIGSHPHVVQEVEFKEFKGRRVPVFYSLGNFISNQQEQHRNGGILAKIEINPRNKGISNVSYIPFYVYKGYLNKLRQYYLIPTTDYITNPSRFPIPRRDSLELVDFHTNIKERLMNTTISK